jgi:hypothetical protein
MIDHMGGRKLVAALVILLVGVGVVALKGDIPANMLALLQTLFGALVLGNAVEHAAAAHVEAKKAAVVATEQPPVVDTIEELHAELSAKLDAQAEATASTAQGVSALLQYVHRATGA